MLPTPSLVNCGSESVARGNNAAYEAACCTVTARLQVFKPLATKSLLLHARLPYKWCSCKHGSETKLETPCAMGYVFRQRRCTLVFVKHALVKSGNSRYKEYCHNLNCLWIINILCNRLYTYSLSHLLRCQNYL